MTTMHGVKVGDPAANPFLSEPGAQEPTGATSATAGSPESPLTPSRQRINMASWLRDLTRSARVRTASQTKPAPIRRESKQARFARFAWRLAIGAAIAVVLLRGLGSIFAGSSQAPAPTVAAASTFPVDAAQAAAARYATAYFTGTPDEASAQLRANALALDASPGMSPQRVMNRQQVAAAVPGGVSVDEDGRRGVAAVSLRISGSPSLAAATWLTVGVPVALAGDRPVVVGEPSLLPVPAPGKVSPAGATTTDTGTSTSSRTTVQATFTAMAGRDPVALSQVAAPGSALTPLPAGVTFRNLESWEVEAGGGDTRTGRAVVAWSMGQGIDLRQSYRVTIRSVTSGSTTDWRVTSVTADH